jgi:NTE family protein
MAYSLGDEIRIGVALGSGSARGWAHIGVLQELEAIGIQPQVVAGTSAGALVGAWFARGHLEASEVWVRSLTRRDVLRSMDLGFAGGLLEGRRLMDLYRNTVGDVRIQDLPMPFAAVATNLTTGQEVWLQKGSLLEAVRASISLPGLFKPVPHGKHWLVAGGLVNPVPVNVCRAMGANVVIAVNLNGDLIGRHRMPKQLTISDDPGWWDRVSNVWSRNGNGNGAAKEDPLPAGPGFVGVLASSINIMQDRITRSRMAGDPPEIVISPRLQHLELMDYARGAEAIEEGRAAVQRARPLIEHMLGREEEAMPEDGELNLQCE